MWNRRIRDREKHAEYAGGAENGFNVEMWKCENVEMWKYEKCDQAGSAENVLLESKLSVLRVLCVKIKLGY
jgi:hypothetical protein